MSMTSSLSNPVNWLIDWFRGGDSDSGVKVTLEQVLGDPSVFSAVRQICEHIALMPVELKRKRDNRWDVVDSSPFHIALNSSPNEIQTPFSFHSTLMLHAILSGNGRAAIYRGTNSQSVEFIPLLPSQTTTCLIEGKKWHVVTPYKDDQIEQYIGRWSKVDPRGITAIPDKDVVHIMGLSYNGAFGLNLIDVLKNAFGLGLAGQKAVASSFKNPKPGVIIQAPPGMLRTEEDAREFMDSFNQFHRGVDSTNHAALLREGMTSSVLPVSAQDAQWIDQRQFHRQEMAQVFGLESFIGDGESSPYKSIGERNAAYMTKCLLPWMVKIEQEYTKKLIAPQQRRTNRFLLDPQRTLRMDIGSAVASFSSAIASRIMSPNEARQRLDMNPYDGGDEFYNPAITPGTMESDEEEPEEPETEDAEVPEEETEPMDRTSQRVIASRIRYLIGVESQRVTRAASGRRQHLGGQKNFLAWQDTFYDKWQKTFAKAIQDYGASADLAETHCQESQRQLLELAGNITDPKTWAAAVAELTETWQARCEPITDAILENRA